jgi:hypothetical protein
VGTASGCTGTISKSGAEYTCTLVVDSAPGTVPKINASTDGSTISYAGGSNAAGTISSATVTQRRASQVAARVGSLGALAQSTPLNQPFLWSGSAWTQTGGLNLAGSEFMAVTFGATLDQPFTVFVVAYFMGAAATEFLYDGVTAGTRSALFYNVPTSKLDAFSGSQVTTGIARPTVATLLECSHNGASSVARVNGTASGSLGIGAQGLTGITVGANYSGLNAMKGYVIDVAIVPSVDTTALTRARKALAQLRSITLAA